MEHLKKYEEVGWVENFFNPNRESKRVINFLRKSSILEDIKETTNVPPKLPPWKERIKYLYSEIDAKLKSSYLKSIDSKSIEGVLKFKILYTNSVRILWELNIKYKEDVFYFLEKNEHDLIYKPNNLISNIVIHRDRICVTGETILINKKQIEEYLGYIVNTIPYVFEITSKRVEFLIKEKDEKIKRDRAKKEREELENKIREEKIANFRSHMVDVEDYLIDIEDMSEDINKGFSKNGTIMFFTFKIDGLEIIKSDSFVLNQKIIDIFKSLNSARDRIERKLPNTKVYIEFRRSNVLSIIIEMLDVSIYIDDDLVDLG